MKMNNLNHLRTRANKEFSNVIWMIEMLEIANEIISAGYEKKLLFPLPEEQEVIDNWKSDYKWETEREDG